MGSLIIWSSRVLCGSKFSTVFQDFLVFQDFWCSRIFWCSGFSGVSGFSWFQGYLVFQDYLEFRVSVVPGLSEFQKLSGVPGYLGSGFIWCSRLSGVQGLSWRSRIIWCSRIIWSSRVITVPGPLVFQDYGVSSVIVVVVVKVVMKPSVDVVE